MELSCKALAVSIVTLYGCSILQQAEGAEQDPDHSPFIWRGTKWCGLGSLPKHNATKPVNGPDLCCREHDSCQYYIARWSRKYHLHNWRPYTITSCTCDKKFQECLKKDGSQISKDLSAIYFSIIKVPCFVFELKETEVCVERNWYFKCIRKAKRMEYHAKIGDVKDVK